MFLSLGLQHSSLITFLLSSFFLLPFFLTLSLLPLSLTLLFLLSLSSSPHCRQSSEVRLISCTYLVIFLSQQIASRPPLCPLLLRKRTIFLITRSGDARSGKWKSYEHSHTACSVLRVLYNLQWGVLQCWYSSRNCAETIIIFFFWVG